ncbi:hypothetical protein [Bradyrhizobium sp. USDA 4353]
MDRTIWASHRRIRHESATTFPCDLSDLWRRLQLVQTGEIAGYLSLLRNDKHEVQPPVMPQF